MDASFLAALVKARLASIFFPSTASGALPNDFPSELVTDLGLTSLHGSPHRLQSSPSPGASPAILTGSNRDKLKWWSDHSCTRCLTFLRFHLWLRATSLYDGKETATLDPSGTDRGSLFLITLHDGGAMRIGQLEEQRHTGLAQ